MLPTDTTRACLRPELIDSSIVPGSVQASPGAIQTFPNGDAHTPQALLCFSDMHRCAPEAIFLVEQGFEVIVCDPLLECSSESFLALFQEVGLVFFDTSEVNEPALRKLYQLQQYRRHHDAKPYLIPLHGNQDRAADNFVEQVVKSNRTISIGDRERIRNQLNPASAARGWGIEIVHRFCPSSDLCELGGGLVWEVFAFNGDRTHSIPIGTREKVVFNFVAHHRIAQTASQWAVRFNESEFVRRHGFRTRCGGNFKCRSSRNGMKQHLWRMGPIIAAGLQEVGIEIDESRIIERIPVGRERKYRLHPGLRVIWKHPKK